MPVNNYREPEADFEILAQTSARQHLASNPQACAWVSANAGSGKTYVLAQRVVRLLLAGVAPSKILCLTFTKAAAAEMANRVFKQLANWTLYDDAQLSQALQKVGEHNLHKEKLREARRLFTRALETPGGLKIQTIHAFCESLLHRFTLEANISGHFEVMGSHEQSQLLRQAQEQVFSNPPDPTVFSAALELALAFGSGDALNKGLHELIDAREEFRNWVSRHGDVATGMLVTAKEIGIEYGLSAEDFCQQLLDQLPMSDQRLIETGIAAGGLEAKEAQRIHNILSRYEEDKPANEKLSIRISLLLKKDGVNLYKKIGEGKLYKLIPGVKEEFEEELEAAIEVLQKYRQWYMLRGSEGLFVIADRVIEEYQRRKTRHGYLDYGDLINKTANLLLRSDVRSWIHYKLDQGIDHVLIDEAQDTSPTQWQIIDGIVAEYFSGHSSSTKNRTVFAVGDQKQSIFSFQGALPEMFNRQKQELASKSEGVKQQFNNVALPVSFRSTRDVLAAVDLVFKEPAMRSGLQDEDDELIHEPSRQSDPGEVVIWPMEMPVETSPKEAWWQPLDALGEESTAVRLARRITDKIKHWIESDEMLEGQGRKIRYGDILILVRHRDQFASAITRELKDAGLSVAGADRLTLVEHIAIEDLLAIAKWALLCEDDLALAGLFKSPLLELSEEQLFEIAHDRGEQTLWQAMLNHGEKADETVKHAMGFLEHCLKSAEKLRPFEFFSEILSKFQGRKKFKARLGDEVDDVLDAFLQEAMNHDLLQGNGLMAFVDNMESASFEIKREIDLERDEIRVMTVHSAKGLEAPIVFLVDSGKEISSSNHRPKIVKTAIGEVPAFLWQPDQSTAVQLTEPFFANHKTKDEEEYRRLLYVGMTRAADRLIVCGFGSKTSARHHTWLPMVRDALVADAREIKIDDEVVEWMWTTKHKLRRPAPLISEQEITNPGKAKLPNWATTFVNVDEKHFPPLNPSLAGEIVQAQSDLPADDLTNRSLAPNVFGIERGNAIHSLLQSLPELPPENRTDTGANYLENHFPHWTKLQRGQLLDEAMAVLVDPQAEMLFGADSQAEVGISGNVVINGRKRNISGQIDRLSVCEDEVFVVDYKSDRYVPAQPQVVSGQYLLQLALYAKLLEDIYPDKKIHAALLWTSKPQFMRIETELLEIHLQNYQGE